MSPLHRSVLLEECCLYLEKDSVHVLIDGTLGAGGHSEAFLQRHAELNLLIGIDQDPEALRKAEKRLVFFKDKLKLFHGNFTKISQILNELGIDKVDAILVDLGVSSMQLDQAEKGFSFMRNGPLDMRMDPTNPLTAEEIVNSWSEREIGQILRDYGEEKKWRKVAHAITCSRATKPIKTTLELVSLLRPLLEEPVWKKQSKIHPLTKTFQALRIAVNRELEVLKDFLKSALKVLKKGGKLEVITFHSLEDRIVKHFFLDAASDKVSTSGIGGIFLDKKPEIKILTRHPIVATDEEISANPRSRSAKLRVAEKL